MKFRRLCIAVTLILIIVISASAQKNGKKSVISQKDKSEILKQVFADGFEKLMEDKTFSLCTIPVLAEKKVILIETNEPNIFPKMVDDYSFKFLERKKIEEEIKSNDGDCYFKINEFQTINPNVVKITLWRWMDVITVINGKSYYPNRWISARGRVYEATKIGKKWKIRFKNIVGAVS